MQKHTATYYFYKIFLTLILLAPFLYSFSQQSPGRIEEELNQLLHNLRAATTNVELQEKNEAFKRKFEQHVEKGWFFDHPFESLTSIGKITSKDGEVRIFSWNVQWENDTHTHFAYILKKHRRKNDQHIVTPLIDNSKALPPEPMDVLEATNWYGALYYDIIEVQKGKKTYYTLLGYNGKNARSTVKLIDVLSFAGNTPRLGYPFFETKEGFQNRVFFEHAAKTVMSLRFDPERNMIVFDHLSPESPGLAEFKEYYVPDMSYDAYAFIDNKWRLKEDIIAINKDDQQKELVLRKYDAESDSVVEVKVKNKWINPSDKDAPIESTPHKAMLPNDDKAQDSKPKNDKNQKEVKQNENYPGVSYLNLPSSKKKKRKTKKKKRR